MQPIIYQENFCYDTSEVINNHIESDILMYFREKYGENILELLADYQDKIQRFKIDGLESITIQSNREHILGMVVIFDYLLKNNPLLKEKIGGDIRKVYKMLFTHDLGEMLTGDYDTITKSKMSSSEKEKLDKKEEKGARIEIVKLKYLGINEDKRREVINSYLDYQKNKMSRGNILENLIKFIDILEATLFIINFLDNFEKIEPEFIQYNFDKLNNINSWFIEDYNIDLLKDYRDLLKARDLNTINREDIQRASNQQLIKDLKNIFELPL